MYVGGPIHLSYWLDDRGSIPSWDRDFLSFRHRVQTGSGTHPTSYPMGKAGGAWSWPRTSIWYRG